MCRTSLFVLFFPFLQHDGGRRPSQLLAKIVFYSCFFALVMSQQNGLVFSQKLNFEPLNLNPQLKISRIELTCLFDESILQHDSSSSSSTSSLVDQQQLFLFFFGSGFLDLNPSRCLFSPVSSSSSMMTEGEDISSLVTVLNDTTIGCALPLRLYSNLGPEHARDAVKVSLSTDIGTESFPNSGIFLNITSSTCQSDIDETSSSGGAPQVGDQSNGGAANQDGDPNQMNTIAAWLILLGLTLAIFTAFGIGYSISWLLKRRRRENLVDVSGYGSL